MATIYGRRLAGSALALTFVAGTGACRSTVDWKNHIAFRSTGAKLELSTWEANELATTAINTNLNYVAISIDSVFFRDLPGMLGADVALGFEITGVLGEGRTIKTVLDTRKSVGEYAFLNFDNLVALEPFLYRGENVTLNFHFTAVPAAESTFLKAQLQGPAGDALKRINPMKYVGVEQGMNMFSSIFGFRAKSWTYGTTMFPADRIYRDKPDLLFAAGRHVLIAVPPANAPPKYRHLKPHVLFKTLKLRGNRLVSIANEEEFTGLPYVVINITRYKRYPKTDTPLRSAVANIDKHIEQGSPELALATLKGLGALINEDPYITATEKNLERSLMNWREERIKTMLAKKNDAKDEEALHIRKELDLLLFSLNEFRLVLEPFEIDNYLYQINERLLRAEHLMKEAKEDPAILAPFKNRYAKVQKVAKAPPPPPTQAGPPIVLPLMLPNLPPEVSVLKKWWFWTAVGTVAAAGVALPIMLKKTETFNRGFVVGP
ncbi:MAG: hypothetical protein HYY84_17615 [Deltaproteobacteria bacterium]|nr:hypothetical protein [Deltaproteobacteria bacterium]